MLTFEFFKIGENVVLQTYMPSLFHLLNLNLEITFCLKIIAATICGFIIGFERQWINRIAGIQTNTLVCVAASIFVSSSYFVSYEGQAASRIGAQVVSGIGFLGAGLIFKDGFTAHGINTAATIWCSAAIGIVCGMNHIDIAFIATIGVVLLNLVLRNLDFYISKKRKPLDLRMIHKYEINVISKKEHYRTLKADVLNTIQAAGESTIFAVKTNILNKGNIEINISIITHNLEYQWVQNIVNKIEIVENVDIVDWAQLKN